MQALLDVSLERKPGWRFTARLKINEKIEEMMKLIKENMLWIMIFQILCIRFELVNDWCDNINEEFYPFQILMKNEISGKLQVKI